MEELYIGKLLDNRYEILEQIGIGGMSVVYKAKCHRLNRMVALKILKPELAKDEDFRRRFHDESQAIAMLSHPNIVSVYDVSKSSELEYIVMELIDGISLKQYMHRRGGALSWKESLHFMTQIVKALGHAHSRGIIHRDIKPQNILVLRDGTVRVADFGIARLLSAQQATLTQEALGSVHYISPEQAKGSRIDCRSDLYSAGVVLYEMLTGQLPFEGDTPVSVAIQHINSIPLSPREHNPEIPEALEAITMKAMAPNMKYRYMDADEMLADLEEFRKNPNISFDYTPEEAAEEEQVDEPTRAIPIAATRKAFATGSFRRKKAEEYEYEDDGEEDEDDYYDDRERKRGVSPIILGVVALLIFFGGIGYFLWVSFFSGLLEPTEYYTIPNLVGKTITEIQLDPAVAGTFTIEQGKVVYSETVPAGQVIKQSPNAGEKRKAGDLVITIEISAGQEEVEMVSVIEKEYREAYVAITELGLNMATPVYVYDENVTKGYIVSQDPAAGTVVSPGHTVNVTVSKGPEIPMVTMISLEGSTVDQAKLQIEELKLAFGEITYEIDMSLPGTVLGQSIAVGTEIPEGSLVDLIISMGPVEDEPVGPDLPVEPPVPTTTPENGETPSGGVVTPNPVPTTKYKNITIALGSGSGTVQVTIKVAGKIAYDNTVERSLGTLNVTIPGTGVQEVSVYLNGAFSGSEIVDFSS